MDQKKTRKERKSTDLTSKELSMLRATSNLSDKEIKLWHTEFIRQHPTGKLDKDTFLNVYKELYPENDAVTNETFLNSIDTNHDGTINFNEFLFFVAITARKGSLDERLDLIFDLWDVSNDGQLDQNEMAHLVSAMYDRAGVKDRQGANSPQKRAKAIIAKLDVSGDKKLSKEEFIKGCKNDEVIGKFLAPDY